MMKKYLSIFVCVLLSTLTFTSCSDDDEVGGNNGSLTVNGEAYKTENSECKNGVLEEYADVGCYFETILSGSENTYIFSIELYNVYDLDKIKVGENITDIVSVSSFHRLTFAESTKFYDDGGKVIVKSVTNKTITLEFEDWTFSRSSGKSSYVVNGTIEYERFD